MGVFLEVTMAVNKAIFKNGQNPYRPPISKVSASSPRIRKCLGILAMFGAFAPLVAVGLAEFLQRSGRLLPFSSRTILLGSIIVGLCCFSVAPLVYPGSRNTRLCILLCGMFCFVFLNCAGSVFLVYNFGIMTN